MKAKDDDNLEDFLYYFALAYLEIFNNSKTIAIARLLYSEVYNEKIDFMKWLKGNNKTNIDFMLQQKLSKENNNIASNAEFLSHTFCAMLRGTFFVQSTFANKISMDKTQQKEYASKVVKLFMQGIVNFN
ncbi:TetR/AcrR family transcriptional regulator C-terminal domain-containing protein [Campylobacter insulaenigrae]|nr:TetR/AcrR family transcriptional regulator C-terminal domain-containing protein [Campylobacter insulaenigrae]MCR6579699.1 TetR/AcrR family transcriptional regulator C-terminal domain-containing protein [Campylobacter insulaenigrae]